MMTVQDRARTKDAVYWARGDKPDAYGQWTYSTPIQTKVKWTKGIFEVQSGQDTSETVSNMVLVGIAMRVGDYLMLGTLTDMTDETVPKNNTGAGIVKQYTENTTHRGTQEIRHAYL